MPQAENAVIREMVTALHHHQIEFIDYKVMKKEAVEKLLKFIASGEVGAKGIAWRNHTGAAKLIGGFVKYGLPGSPDILLLLKGGLFRGLEGKVPGEKPTSVQASFHQVTQMFGGLIETVHSYEETDKVLTAWGY